LPLEKNTRLYLKNNKQKEKEKKELGCSLSGRAPAWQV
jgi:hypothetical protein